MTQTQRIKVKGGTTRIFSKRLGIGLVGFACLEWGRQHSCLKQGSGSSRVLDLSNLPPCVLSSASLSAPTPRSFAPQQQRYHHAVRQALGHGASADACMWQPPLPRGLPAPHQHTPSQAPQHDTQHHGPNWAQPPASRPSDYPGRGILPVRVVCLRYAACVFVFVRDA